MDFDRTVTWIHHGKRHYVRQLLRCVYIGTRTLPWAVPLPNLHLRQNSAPMLPMQEGSVRCKRTSRPKAHYLRGLRLPKCATDDSRWVWLGFRCDDDSFPMVCHSEVKYSYRTSSTAPSPTGDYEILELSGRVKGHLVVSITEGTYKMIAI